MEQELQVRMTEALSMLVHMMHSKDFRPPHPAPVQFLRPGESRERQDTRPRIPFAQAIRGFVRRLG